NWTSTSIQATFESDRANSIAAIVFSGAAPEQPRCATHCIGISIRPLCVPLPILLFLLPEKSLLARSRAEHAPLHSSAPAVLPLFCREPASDHSLQPCCRKPGTRPSPRS